MKNNNEDNEELQLVLDSIVQALSDIKEELTVIKNSNSDSLSTDLLNKIIEIIDQSKKGITAKELQAYSAAVVATARQLQDEANVAFTQFLNEKILQLEQITKQPSVIKNHYEIDFKSSKMFCAVLFISLGLFCSLIGNYNQYRKNQKLMDNDLKYRFVKMNNGILPDEISRLENFFYYSDSVYVVNNIRKSVIDYEHRMEEQARKLEQKRQNEETIDKLDKEIELLR